MFKNLSDFGYIRSGKEAFGFYLAYLLFIIVIGAIASSLFNSLPFVESHEAFYTGIRVGTFVAIVSCLTLAYLIVVQKNHNNSYVYLLLALFAGLSALVGGALLGLIIPSILTMQGEKSVKTKTKPTKRTTKKKKSR